MSGVKRNRESDSAQSSSEPRKAQHRVPSVAYVVSCYIRQQTQYGEDKHYVLGVYTNVDAANLAAVEYEPDSQNTDQATTSYDDDACITVSYGFYGDESNDAVVQVTKCIINNQASNADEVEEAIEELGRNSC